MVLTAIIQSEASARIAGNGSGSTRTLPVILADAAAELTLADLRRPATWLRAPAAHNHLRHPLLRATEPGEQSGQPNDTEKEHCCVELQRARE